MDLSDGFEAALQNQQLIYGVLKRLHVFTNSQSYQDYFQEATIIYAQTYTEYLQSKKDVSKLQVYIFQRLLWRMTDLLRDEQRFFSTHSLEEFDFERVEQDQFCECFDELDLDCLTAREKSFFYDCFVVETPITKLANKYRCSARNLRYYRKNIQDKLKKRFS